jgi:prevent-host-death family protein
MKTISIRELHLKTGQWVRQASQHKRVVITERSDPVATLIPFERAHAATPFAARKLLPGFVKLPAPGATTPPGLFPRIARARDPL